MATEALIENLIVPWDRCPCQPSWLSSLAEVDLCKACFSNWPKVFGSLCRRKIWSIVDRSILKGFWESTCVTWEWCQRQLLPRLLWWVVESLIKSWVRVRKGTEKLSWPKSSLETNELLGVNGPSQFSIEIPQLSGHHMPHACRFITQHGFVFYISVLSWRQKRLKRLQRQQRRVVGDLLASYVALGFVCLNHTASIIFEGKLQVVFEVWGPNLWKLWICQTKILCHPQTEHISKATQSQLASFIQLGEKFLHIPKICQNIRRKVSRDLRAHTGLEPSKMEWTASCRNPYQYDAPDFKPRNSLEIREFLVRRNHGQSSQELVGFWMVWKWSLWVVGSCYSGKLRG